MFMTQIVRKFPSRVSRFNISHIISKETRRDALAFRSTFCLINSILYNIIIDAKGEYNDRFKILASLSIITFICHMMMPPVLYMKFDTRYQQ